MIRDLRTGSSATIAEQATYGRYVSSGYLLYAKGTGDIVAVRFDSRRKRVIGDPALVQPGVRVAQWGGGASLAVSDGGTLVSVGGSTFARYLLAWFDRAGRRINVLGQPLTGAAASLSPTGDQVLLTVVQPEGGDIWIWHPVTGMQQRQTFDIAFDETPVWSPDGRQFAFSSTAVGGTAIEMKTLGGDIGMIFRDTLHMHLTSWSPDGRWLALSAERPTTGRDIFFLDVNAADSLVVAIASAANEGSAHFSPDGRSVAYESDESGKTEVYVRSMPELGALQQVSIGGGSDPRWSRDGTELFFWRGDTLLTVGLSHNVIVSSAAPVFHLRGEYAGSEGSAYAGYYDVSHDGRRFLVMLHNPDVPSKEIRVTLNWLKPMAR